jgi:uncharacterized protein YndB with AHSA1/START domain
MGETTVDVATDILIDVPRDRVAAYAANPENAPAWYVNIKTARATTSAPVKIGSEIEFIAHFLGRRLRYTYEVTEFVPGERLVMRTADGPFPMETTYTWESITTDRTRMTLRNRGAPAGFSRLIAPFVRRAMRQANANDLKRLKAILEQQLTRR